MIPRAEQLLIPMEQEKRSAFYEERFEEISGFSAVFAASDHYAADFLHFVQSKGISVPRQMSVAGFDDSALSRQLHPMLTTIGQNHAARAKLAVEVLIKLRKQIAVEPEILLPVKLMQRNSTAPASAQSHLQSKTYSQNPLSFTIY